MIRWFTWAIVLIISAHCRASGRTNSIAMNHIIMILKTRAAENLINNSYHSLHVQNVLLIQLNIVLNVANSRTGSSNINMNVQGKKDLETLYYFQNVKELRLLHHLLRRQMMIHLSLLSSSNLKHYSKVLLKKT